MKEGGCLDQFPLHLLACGSTNSATVVIDNPELGRLQINPVTVTDRTIIVLGENWPCLNNTKKLLKHLGGGNIQLLMADPKRLPFFDNSVQGVVTFLSKKFQIARTYIRKATKEPSFEELKRILDGTGWNIQIQSKFIFRRVRRDDKRLGCSELERYYVHPSTGHEYFVTKVSWPYPWPLRSLELGKITLLRIGFGLALKRLQLPSFSNSLSIKVHLKDKSSGIIERFNESMKREVNGICSGRLNQSNFGLYVKSNWNAILLRLDAMGVIVKFPLSITTSESLRKHAKNVKFLHATDNKLPKTVIPKIVDEGVLLGQTYWTEERIEGLSSTKRKWIPGWNNMVIEAGFNFLMDLHQSSSELVKIHRNQFNKLLVQRAASVEKVVRRIDPLFDLRPLLNALWNVFGDVEIPLVRTHGDFWPGNIIISSTGKLKGVLDWDASVPKGWPLLDLLHFIAFQNKRRAYWHFGTVVTKKLFPGKLAARERKMLDEYSAMLSIRKSHWYGFVTLYWLETISHYVQFESPERWLKRNAINPLSSILGYI